jgi:hypothetical protein
VGMSSGAAHQAGSQRVTVTDVTHPQPTMNMGQAERGERGGTNTLQMDRDECCPK